MKKKKGLVYDSQHGISRFLKYEFKTDYVFDVYKDFKKFDDVIESYDVIFFVVYREAEILDLMRLYRRKIPLIVSTLNKEIKLKLEKIEDILLFDSSSVKSEMRTELKFFLNIVS